LFTYLYLEPLIEYLETTMENLADIMKHHDILLVCRMALRNCKTRDIGHFIRAVLRSRNSYLYLNALIIFSDAEMRSKIMGFVFSEISGNCEAENLNGFYSTVKSHFKDCSNATETPQSEQEGERLSLFCAYMEQLLEKNEKVPTFEQMYRFFIAFGKDLILSLEEEYYEKLKQNIVFIPKSIVNLLSGLQSSKI
ncbi:hypothetical protein ENBRE01_3272, partial [Enteropsectra breve]